MFFEAKLVFRNYFPDMLEKGMLFIRNGELIQLEHVPSDEKSYLEQYGYPIELYIVSEGNPNLNDDVIIAHPDQIGWMDEGDHSDELSDISMEELNHIIQEYEGALLYQVDIVIPDDSNEEPYYTPLLIDNKVVIRLLSYDSQETEMENPEYWEQEDNEWYPSEDDI